MFIQQSPSEILRVGISVLLVGPRPSERELVLTRDALCSLVALDE